MLFNGIEIPVKSLPSLDEGFVPLAKFNETLLSCADVPISIGIERPDGQLFVYRSFIQGSRHSFDLDCLYINRLVKCLLWTVGGFRVHVQGDYGIYNYLNFAFAPGGEQEADYQLISRLFEAPLQLVFAEALPESAVEIAPPADSCCGSISVLSVSMDEKLTADFMDEQGQTTGRLNALAIVPVAAAINEEDAPETGLGINYLTAGALTELALRSGIEIETTLSPQEKLKVVQALAEDGDERAVRSFRDMGVYLAHSLACWYPFYFFHNALLTGSLMSGKGGELLEDSCKAVLWDEYPELWETIRLSRIELPEDGFISPSESEQE